MPENSAGCQKGKDMECEVHKNKQAARPATEVELDRFDNSTSPKVKYLRTFMKGVEPSADPEGIPASTCHYWKSTSLNEENVKRAEDGCEHDIHTGNSKTRRAITDTRKELGISTAKKRVPRMQKEEEVSVCIEQYKESPNHSKFCLHRCPTFRLPSNLRPM